MASVFRKKYHITASAVDRYDRLKASHILDYLQEIAGDHCAELGTTRQDLLRHRLFWAVIRHRVQITRLPHAGEDITVETWPMPTTRTAYPRAAVAFDEAGQECFRCISVWVLMDLDSRAMVLPGKSCITVDGILRGNELTAPGSMAVRERGNRDSRTVRFTDLDWNGHMNNCRYLDWVTDTLPSSFHEGRSAREFSVCYFSEAKEGEHLSLGWELSEDGILSVDASREESPSAGGSRVFSARMIF